MISENEFKSCENIVNFWIDNQEFNIYINDGDDNITVQCLDYSLQKHINYEEIVLSKIKNNQLAIDKIKSIDYPTQNIIANIKKNFEEYKKIICYSSNNGLFFLYKKHNCLCINPKNKLYFTVEI